MRLRSLRLLSGAAVLALLTACGQPAVTSPGAVASSSAGAAASPETAGTAAPSANATESAGMNHNGHGDQMSEAPFDAMFIDGMIEHHEGAIAMAEHALDRAERPEVRELAQAIITAQQREIEQLQSWRAQWYVDVPPTGGMQHMDMGAMEVSDDESKPFDQRFIEAMIPHHESAVMMAREAQQQAEHAEMRELADQIIEDQEREIEQMRRWLQQWYGG